jgi:hypothetical protein
MNPMGRRFQFSLKWLFFVTTTAAVFGAAWRPLVRIWDSLDLLAALLVIAALPLLGLAAFLMMLPFAYRRAVREIAARGAETPAACEGHEETDGKA